MRDVSTEMTLEQVGQRVLQECLRSAPALAHLNLSDNHMGEAGTDRLAGVLVHCAAMSHLDLRINQIGAVGIDQSDRSCRGRKAWSFVVWSSPSSSFRESDRESKDVGRE